MGITGVLAAGAIAGAGANIFGSQQAAGAQKDASNKAIQFLQGAYGNASNNLSPWIGAGQGAINQLTQLTGTNPGGNPLTAPLTTPFQPTQQQLEATPGYQFTLNQGLKAVQNRNSAMGLGGSGEALAGAASFATGLANQTYQQQFGNYWSQNQAIYNMLGGISNAGNSSSLGLGQIGAGIAGGQGQAAIGAGNAQAAASNTLGQSLGNLFTGGTQTYAQNALLPYLYSGNSTQQNQLAGILGLGIPSFYGGSAGTSQVPGGNQPI